MSELRLLDSSRPSTLLKMDVESPSLAKFPSTEASIFWYFLLALGDVDCRLLRLSKLPLSTFLVRRTPIPPIITSPLSWGGTYSNITVTCSSNVSARSAYMPRSPENTRAAVRRNRDYFRRTMCRKLDSRRSRSRNPIINPRVNCCGGDQEGPVTQ